MIPQNGYRNILCKDSFIYHYGSKSFGKNTPIYNDILNINNNKFQNKWKLNPQKSLYTQGEILELIDKDIDSHLNILEIGCTCGATLLEIKNKYPNANLYGFELSNTTAKIEKSFTYVTTGDIDNFSLPYEEKFFDFIILADILSNLKYPLKTLENIQNYLKPDGYILASIPNALNFTILRDLINGNWQYENEGFCDSPPLKLFTYKDIISLFNNDVFLTQLVNLIKLKNLNYNDIIEAVENKIVHQGKISNHIAVKCSENNLEEYVLPLLEKANSLQPRDLNITYNLSFYLAKEKKFEIALKYLNSLYDTDNNIEELKHTITKLLH